MSTIPKLLLFIPKLTYKKERGNLLSLLIPLC